jgi:hypothetical protein
MIRETSFIFDIRGNSLLNCSQVVSGERILSLPNH